MAEFLINTGVLVMEDRYFIAEVGGTAERVLNDMERAGRSILDAFSQLDKFRNEGTPVQLILNGNLKGFSIMPNDWRLRAMIVDGLTRAYSVAMHEVSAYERDAGLAVAIPR